MRFEWTEEQLQLQDMARRMFSETHDFDARKRRICDGDGGAMWRAMAELGLLALPFAEDHGGIGGTPLDTVLIMEAFGRSLLIEPYIAAIVFAGGILRRTDRSEWIDDLVGRLIGGQTCVTVAWSEPSSRHDPLWCETAVSGSMRLSGHKAMVVGGDEADAFIVLARSAGLPGDVAGLDLLLVPADREGVSIRRFRNIDGSGAAELEFVGVAVTEADRLCPSGRAAPMFLAALAEATVAACAEAVGAMSALNEKTLAYVRERKAFGKALADFQALQHRLVDMRISQEQASAITLKAAQALTLGRSDAAAAVAAAKYLVNEEGRTIAKAAVQMHGAIGITDELDISHYFRRLYTLSVLYGDSGHHLSQYVQFNASGE